MTQLRPDLAGATPRLLWITPGLCNDTHDCPVRRGDQWLSSTVPDILASAAWRQDGVLLITWDEDDAGSSGNQVPLLIIAPNLKAHQLTAYEDHYSLLATIEERLGVPRLGAAAKAVAISGVFG